MKVTRDQAACMFYYLPYNEENVAISKKRLEAQEGLDLCYNTSELEPILASIE